MKRFLRHPLGNTICISLFTAFYAVMMHYAVPLSEDADAGGMTWMREFTGAGGVGALSVILIGLTVLTAVLLLTRKRALDEYQGAVLSACLVTALILTIAAIGIFFMNILFEPSQVRLKLTLFALIHWATVVAADLVFVLVCGRR